MIETIPYHDNFMLIVISGPPASGKSTIAQLLAQKFSKSVLLSKDFIFHLVRGGHFDPWKETVAAKKQFALNNSVMRYIIKTYLSAGYTVIVEGIFENKQLAELSKAANNIRAFRLVPSLAALKSRDRGRSLHKQIPHRLKPLHDLMKSDKGSNFYKIDNTGFTVNQTLNLIYSQLHENSR